MSHVPIVIEGGVLLQALVPAGTVVLVGWCPKQVTRFAAPLAYNYLHVIRMNEYLGEGRVSLALGPFCVNIGLSSISVLHVPSNSPSSATLFQ